MAVEVRGRRAGLRRERGAEPALILLHGAGGNSASFDELIEHLPGRDVVTVDLPGRCGSDGPPARSIEEAAAFVEELIEALELPRVVVAGHSMGGAVALEIGLRASPAVAGLIVMASGARLRVHPLILRLMREAAAKSGGTTPAPGSGGRVPEVPGLWRKGTDPALVERVQRCESRTPAATRLADWEMTDRFDRLGALDRIQVPVLVLCGDADRMTPPKYAEYLEHHVSGARLVRIPDGGHLFPIERARETAAEIQRFITDGPIATGRRREAPS